MKQIWTDFSFGAFTFSTLRLRDIFSQQIAKVFREKGTWIFSATKHVISTTAASWFFIYLYIYRSVHDLKMRALSFQCWIFISNSQSEANTNSRSSRWIWEMSRRVAEHHGNDDELKDEEEEYEVQDLRDRIKSSRGSRFNLIKNELGLDDDSSSILRRFSRQSLINGVKGLSHGVIHPDNWYASSSISLIYLYFYYCFFKIWASDEQESWIFVSPNFSAKQRIKKKSVFIYYNLILYNINDSVNYKEEYFLHIL